MLKILNILLVVLILSVVVWYVVFRLGRVDYAEFDSVHSRASLIEHSDFGHFEEQLQTSARRISESDLNAVLGDSKEILRRGLAYHLDDPNFKEGPTQYVLLESTLSQKNEFCGGNTKQQGAVVSQADVRLDGVGSVPNESGSGASLSGVRIFADRISESHIRIYILGTTTYSGELIPVVDGLTCTPWMNVRL